MKQLKLLFTVLFLAVLGLGNVWGETVTYTVTSTSAVSVSGTAPQGASATYSSTYTTAKQLTAGKKMTLTLGGYAGYKITGIKLYMKSNGSAGAGYLSATAGSTTLASIGSSSSGVAFSNASWNGEYTTSYTNVIPTMSSTTYSIASGENVVIVIGATTNSLYCESFTLTYEDANAPTVSSIAVKTAPTKTEYVEGEMFNPAGLVITKTMSNSSAADVEYASNGNDFTFFPALTTALATTDTKVTITYGGKSVDQAITVNAFTPTAGEYEIALNNVFFNCDAFTSKPTGFTSATGSDKGVTIKYIAAANAYINATQCRMYKDTKLEFTAPTGFELTSIVLGTTTASPSISADAGSFSGKTWTGNATSVTLTGSQSSGNYVVTSVTVTYAEKVASSVATPELSVAAGTYEGTKNVKVSNYDAELSYYYTLDGTAPTNASTAYNHATGIDVTASATLKVIAYDAESNASDVASAAYTIIPVYTSITELLAAGDPTTTGWTVKITLTDVEITSFQGTKGVWIGAIQIYGDVTYPNTWAVGGTLSGTLTCIWKLYGTTKELCPSDWSNLEYTAPSTPVVTPEYASLTELIAAGAPTAGGKDVKVTFTNDIITRITDDRKGIFFMVGEQEVEVYCTTACPAEWTVNGQVSGTLVEGSWKLYTPREGDPVWEVVVADWAAFEYTAYVSHVTGVTFANGSVFAGKTLTLASLVEIAPADASNKNVSFEIVSGSQYITLEEGVVTGVAEGSAVVRVTTEDGSFTADATIAVEAVSVWATTYTSNVTLTANADTKASKEKVKVNDEETQYDALKCGTKSDDGSCKVILPLGTTKLHFHAVTWDGSSATATLSIKKVGNDTELFGHVIRPNTGFSGNNPYTLVGEPTDDYYCINFGSALTEATTLVFDASVNRFAIYGVNVETADVELLSIAVSGTPSQLEYYEGQPLATAGLIVTGTYNLGDPQTITEGISWNVTPTTLALGTTSVSVVATVGEISSEPYVVEGIQVNTLGDLGTAVIIVFPYNDSYYAMASDLTPVEVHMVNGKVVGVAEADRASLTWYKNEAESKATFQTIDGDYLAGSTKTNLETQATEYKWDVVDGHYQVTISGTDRTFIYNGTKVGNYATSNVGKSDYSEYPIFATDFMDGEEATLRENLTVGAIGTYCADKNVDYYEGATFYVPEYKTMAGEHAASVYFVEAKTLEARHAYIYVAEAEEITAIVSGDAESTAVTGEPMVGTLKDTLFSVEANYTVYIVYENELRPVVKDAKVSLAAGRAYLNMNVLSSNAPATPAPGRKRISMGVTGANTATGLDNVEGNANVQKVLVNGNIYILRGEKMFNINGQLVK